MNALGYVVILTDSGSDLMQKIDSNSLRRANDLPYVISRGFHVDHGFLATLQIWEKEDDWMTIQIPVNYVLGTVFLGDNKRVAGFGADDSA